MSTENIDLSMILDGCITVLFVYRWVFIVKTLMCQWFLMVFEGKISDFGKMKSVKKSVISMVLR
jgi:hypothetical protein